MLLQTLAVAGDLLVTFLLLVAFHHSVDPWPITLIH